jgi:hypothetical protein
MLFSKNRAAWRGWHERRRGMPDHQLDLFGDSGDQPPAAVAPALPLLPPAVDLHDEALIAAIPDAGVADYQDLVTEAVRRRLPAALPALEALCRRFKGFGLARAVRQQTMSIRAIATIGGRDAAAAVTRIICDGVIQGPGVATAVQAAAALHCRLPAAIAAPLLRHADPAIRADAARCAAASAEVIAVLLDLREDLHPQVAQAAACALGRWGRTEVRPMLLHLLQHQPSVEVIEAITPVADDACAVVLGRIARTHPEYADAALAALEELETDRAAAIAASARKSLGRG